MKALVGVVALALAGTALTAGTAVDRSPMWAGDGVPSVPRSTVAGLGDGTDVAARTARPDRAAPASAPRARWQWPLRPRPVVERPFVEPSSQWGAGHRGLDLRGAEGKTVRAVASGVVTHVGVIAGRPTVTVTHPDGLRSTYEPVAAVVSGGQQVGTGDVLGTLVTTGSHCLPRACLHLGALRGTTYLDPMTLLGVPRVRLLPLWR